MQPSGLGGCRRSNSSARDVLTLCPCLPLPVQSPLCDAPTFVRQLEGTYAQLWQRWLDQQQHRWQKQEQQRTVASTAGAAPLE